MKKGILMMYCLVLFLLPHPAFSQSISIAAARIEAIGVREDTARLLDELITTSLTREALFTVIERNRIDLLLEEQKFQQSGITDTSGAVRLGGILNADKILLGSIGKYDSKYVEFILSLRLIDVERAEVELAESIQVRSVEDLPAQVEEIIRRISAGMEIRGRISGIKGSAVYVSLGSRGGVRAGDLLSVYRVGVVRDEAGKILMREEVPLANLRAETVQEESSRCSVVDSTATPEPGLFVRRGRADLGTEDDFGTISVDSIPQGARVFLDGDFFGETPLTAASIPEGNYKIEIRAGGYTPYYGTIKLRAGRMVSIERELDQEIEIEDLIMLGKLPRKSTDPTTAMRKAFIPGQGLVYNGYRNLGLVLPAQLFSLLSLGAYLAVSVPPEEGGPPTSGTYWDEREYYRDIDRRNDDLLKAAVLAGTGLGIYAFSIVDSAMSAEDDFLYPAYLELSFGGCGGYTRLVQTADNDSAPDFNSVITSGLEESTGGGFMDLTFMGRKYHLMLGMDYLMGALIIRLESAFRFALSEEFFLGVGGFFSENVIEPSDIEFTGSTGGEAFSPSPGGYGGPMLQMSYRPSDFSLDLWLSPYTIGRVHTFALESGDTWVDVDGVGGIRGFSGGLRGEYFFSLSTGIRLSADVYALSNNKSELAEQGITSADEVLDVNVKAGMVYRF